jgi:hypothetical protein
LGATAPQGREQAGLFQGLTDLSKDCLEIGRCERIEQRAALLVTGHLLATPQGLHGLVPLGVLPPALICQKRR